MKLQYCLVARQIDLTLPDSSDINVLTCWVPAKKFKVTVWFRNSEGIEKKTFHEEDTTGAFCNLILVLIQLCCEKPQRFRKQTAS